MTGRQVEVARPLPLHSCRAMGSRPKVTATVTIPRRWLPLHVHMMVATDRCGHSQQILSSREVSVTGVPSKDMASETAELETGRRAATSLQADASMAAAAIMST